MTELADRMMTDLPGEFRRRDDSGDLDRLLAALGAVFFADQLGAADLPGLEARLGELPALFRPIGEDGAGGLADSTPDAFLPWLAEWLAFTPHPLLERGPLRRVLAAIAPMYGRRGTKGFLHELLMLACDEPLSIEIDDYLPEGLIVGRASLGVDSRLSATRPLRFRLSVTLGKPLDAGHLQALERRLRALIEFGKPAFTTYDLQLHDGANGHGQAGRAQADQDGRAVTGEPF